MVKASATYKGALRCRLVHGPSGHEIFTDAPVDNHGKGELFSPTDPVAAALASCTLTVMGIVAERHGVDMTEATAEATKEMVQAPARRIGKLSLAITFLKPVPLEKRSILERAAHECPVGKSLHPETEVSISFKYPGA